MTPSTSCRGYGWGLRVRIVQGVYRTVVAAAVAVSVVAVAAVVTVVVAVPDVFLVTDD